MMNHGQDSLPPVQKRRGSSASKQEWRKLIEIQQHLLLTSSRSSKQKTVSQTGQGVSHGEKQKSKVQISVPECNRQKGSDKSSSSRSLTPPGAYATKRTTEILGHGHLCSSAPALLGEQKILLHTAEVMETLSILLHSENQGESTVVTEVPPEVILKKRKILKSLHERMKFLMKQRCLIVIKKECSQQVHIAVKLRDEIRNLALTEHQKILALIRNKKPIFPKDVLELSLLKKTSLLDNLQTVTMSWSWLLKFLGHTFGSFDVEWHSSLDSVLTRTHSSLVRVKNEAFYWTFFSLQNNIKLLCHVDSSDLHAEWIQSLFNSCQFFNKVLGENFSSSSLEDKNCSPLTGVKPLPISVILRTLAKRQAKFAAHKMAAFVCSESKKELNSLGAFSEFSWLPATADSRDSDKSAKAVETSDYYSASMSEPRGDNKNDASNNKQFIRVKSTESGSISVSSVLSILVQCGQSLLLKYLFAVTCLDCIPSSSKGNKDKQGSKKNTQGRQIWQKPVKQTGLSSCSQFEKLYWNSFWNQFIESMMQNMTQLSEASETVLEALPLCPDKMSLIILRMLNLPQQELVDLPAEAFTSIKHIHQKLYFVVALSQWRETYNQAMVLAMLRRCPPVPLSSGSVGTSPGNQFLFSLEPLVGYFSSNQSVNLKDNYLVKQLLTFTLYYILNWAESRQRTALSYWDPSSYLLIGCSDLKRIAFLLVHLKEKCKPGLWREDKPQMKIMMEADSACLASIQTIENHTGVIYNEYYQKSFSVFSERLDSEMPPPKYWKNHNIGASSPSQYIVDATESLLNPVLHTVSALDADVQNKVVMTTVKSLVHAWQKTIHKKKLKFSHQGALQLSKDIQHVVDQVQRSEVNSTVKENIFNLKDLQEFTIVSQFLTEPPETNTQSPRRGNKVSPGNPHVASRRGQYSEIEVEKWKQHKLESSRLPCCS